MCTSDAAAFNPSNSSTSTNVNSTVDIPFEAVNASGQVFEDTVSFGGFTLLNQAFRTQISVILVTGLHLLSSVGIDSITDMSLAFTLSGVMGLSFQNLSAVQNPPIWQALASQNSFSKSIFGVYLERDVGPVDVINTTTTTPGGTLTLGGTNTSLYTGNIEFTDMPRGATPSYWFQQVQSECFLCLFLGCLSFHSAVVVQGKLIGVPSDNGLAVIDTGNPYIGVPASIAQQIWANVPGSEAMNGTYAYRTYSQLCTPLRMPHAVCLICSVCDQRHHFHIIRRCRLDH